jgi:hypothetical protein
MALLTLVSGAVAAASMCPEANYDACIGEGYAIVETEPIEYIPHNQMESAHRLHYAAATGLKKPVVRHKRYRVVRRRRHVCWH